MHLIQWDDISQHGHSSIVLQIVSSRNLTTLPPPVPLSRLAYRLSGFDWFQWYMHKYCTAWQQFRKGHLRCHCRWLTMEPTTAQKILEVHTFPIPLFDDMRVVVDQIALLYRGQQHQLAGKFHPSLRPLSFLWSDLFHEERPYLWLSNTLLVCDLAVFCRWAVRCVSHANYLEHSNCKQLFCFNWRLSCCPQPKNELNFFICCTEHKNRAYEMLLQPAIKGGIFNFLVGWCLHRQVQAIHGSECTCK